MSRLFHLTMASSVAALLMAVSPAKAVVLIDDQFDAANGYTDGLIQFQQPNGADNGIWLGQARTEVNTTDGVVEGRGQGFLRNAWSLGAGGTPLGGPLQNDENTPNLEDRTTEVGNGFTEGDVIKVSSEFQFTLAAAGNAGIYNFGVTDCFVQCSGGNFNPAPRAGIETGYNNFGSGQYKIFTNYARNSNSGPDNAFGVLLDGLDIGIVNGKMLDEMGMEVMTGDPLDLESDTLRIEYTAQLTNAATDTWTSTDLIITNVTTDTVLSDAKVDQPMALESWNWNAEVDNPFTPDVNEGGLAAHDSNPGSEMWFAGLWVPAADILQETNVSSVRFEYLPFFEPIDGDYNNDGFVDAADYTVWRDSNESVGSDLPADGTGDDLLGTPDGDVDDFDRQFWAANYGSNAFGSAAAIPEPSTLMLGVLVAVGAMARRQD